MRLLLAALVVPLLANAQVASFGVKGGAALGNPSPDFGPLTVSPGHWTVGPTAEFFLPYRFSIEIDALYSGYRMRGITRFSAGLPTFAGGQTTGAPGFQTDSRWDTKAWDFPALLKYRFTTGPVNPFVFAGFNYRHESSDISTTCTALDGGPCPANVSVPSTYSTSQDRTGPVTGVGLEIRRGHFRISPEFRYVHLDRRGADQYNLLLGFSF
jgi:hypothetical protein